MTDLELAMRLSKTRANAGREKDQKSNAYVLCGIKYTNKLADSGRVEAVATLARRRWPVSGGSETAATDVRYGVRIAPYVENADPPWWLD